MNVAEAAVAQALLIHGGAVTVHGHTHRYGIHQIIAADLHQTRYMLAN
jgi:UDP-2,3-diacylglucosamine pyrophosphatase LpxH